MAHHMFRARTIMVGEKGPIHAYSKLMQIMSIEGQTRDIKLKQRHEKNTVKVHRLRYEEANRIYNQNMKGKIELLMKVQRKEYPWT